MVSSLSGICCLLFLIDFMVFHPKHVSFLSMMNIPVKQFPTILMKNAGQHRYVHESRRIIAIPNDTQNPIFIFVEGVWMFSMSMCIRSKLSISFKVLMWLSDVWTSFMLVCSMEMSLARVAKSSCN